MENYYPIGKKFERELRKDGIVKSAVVIDFDLDTKLYSPEWEENNKDIEKESNYTG